MRLSPIALQEGKDDAYWLAFSPELADWPPLAALRQWLFDEMAASQRALDEAGAGSPAST